ncbi:phosphopyruvate hydratase [Mycobacterium mantenii]|uniref:Enolase n=1 Tax=Mycobacterium mantenii TaxID=560555 RepID=A0A1A2TV73_MYCNT|nr:enolase [Mycobacterium mantenii]OBH48538.1 enolase [Mycobacterium mantenii]OBH77126.1 enolase [Mycobacterium mantenii]OBH80388.1 enolase [Mycobacterium mantenii]
MMKIASVIARQLLDCKARPLLEVEITTDTGHVGRGASPTGCSVGSHEAFVLRDGDRSQYNGLGVHRAIAAVTDEIAPALVGAELDDPRSLDRVMIELDGTPDKHRLGGNAIYSTSVALLRAAAAAAGMPTYTYVGALLGLQPPTTVPVPSFNMINGGHYGDVCQTFSEFLVVPYAADSIESAVEKGVSLFETLGEVLAERLGRAPMLASSYGYIAPSSDPRVVMEVLAEAVERAGCADIMAFALDCASSEVYDNGSATYAFNGARVTAEALIDYVRGLCGEFPMLFVEDLLDGDDWAGFAKAVQAVNRSIILGDDLIVTNPARLQRAVEASAVDGFILKPNQVGTIAEALDCFEYATRNAVLAIPSGRSGGVIDDVVMDLAVGLGAPFQKNGAPRSGERIAKLNFLLRAAERIPDCALADVPALAKF